MAPRRLNHDAYKVGWICPLEVEQVAAMEMLDEEHQPLPQPRGDTNVYRLGSINNHNIVVAGLPGPGNCLAATTVSQMRMTFPNLRYGLLVGIGGGVPVETEQGMIRLGHVVVSKPTNEHSGAVQYDHGKARAGNFERKGFLGPPPMALLNAAREVAVQRHRMDHDPVWENTQRVRTDRRGLRHFRYPGAAKDALYQSDYEHQKIGLSCQRAGCDPAKLIKAPTDAEEEPFVVVHRGTIASGELVIKDARKRDELAREYGVLCFEMEAAGALTDFPCMVIRGISDYCDSHKNDAWHGYAAAVAAAYARQLFAYMPIEAKQREWNTEPTKFEIPFSLHGFTAVSEFVARDVELALMTEVLQGGTGRRTVVVHGLGGIGKTQLAIAYAKRHRGYYTAALFLNAEDQSTLKKSFTRAARWILRHHPTVTYIASALQSPGLNQTVTAVRRWLDEPTNDRWIVVCDNYDYPLVNRRQAASSCGNQYEFEKAFDLRACLPESDHGTVIVTTRSSMVNLGRNIHLRKIESIDDCLQILASSCSHDDLKQDPKALDLVNELDGLPLALATAGAYLEQVPITCSEYLELYRTSWPQLDEETPQLPTYDRTLYSTWDTSYKYVEQQSTIAAKLLRLWAYFDNEDLWYELLQAGSTDKPEWLVELTKDKRTFDRTLRILCSHGLAEINSSDALPQVDSKGYSLHKCVHAWVIHAFDEEVDEEMAWVAISCVTARASNRERSECNDCFVEQRLSVGHANQTLAMLNKVKQRDMRTARAFQRLGALYLDLSKPESTGAILKEALHVCQEVADDQEYEDTFDHVARLQEEIITSLEDALQGYMTAYGLEHEETFDVIICLAKGYLIQDKRWQGYPLFPTALKVLEEGHARKHQKVVVATVPLDAEVYGTHSPQRRRTKLEQVLQVYEKTWGREDEKSLDILVCLGNFRADNSFLSEDKQKELQEAEGVLQESVTGYKKIYGRNNAKLSYAMASLGNVYYAREKLQEAEAILEESLTGYKKIYRRKHKELVILMSSLAKVYLARGKLKEAKITLKDILQDYEKIHRGEWLTALCHMGDLGAGYLMKYQLEEAEQICKESLIYCEKNLVIEESVLQVMRNWGSSFSIRQPKEAEKLYKKILQTYWDELGPVTFATNIKPLLIMENLGYLYVVQGRVREALSYWKLACDGYGDISGIHWAVEGYERLCGMMAGLEAIE